MRQKQTEVRGSEPYQFETILIQSDSTSLVLTSARNTYFRYYHICRTFEDGSSNNITRRHGCTNREAWWHNVARCKSEHVAVEPIKRISL